MSACPAFQVRDAVPADVPSLMRLKLLLAEAEDSVQAVRADAADWLRDGFGPGAGFKAFVAEVADTVVGMATCSRRVITGWNGPMIFLQDLYVEPACRKHGVASALVARVAALRARPRQPDRRTHGARRQSRAGFLSAQRLPAAAALPDLRAGRSGARRARRARRRSSPAGRARRADKSWLHCGCQIISAITATSRAENGSASAHQTRNRRRYPAGQRNAVQSRLLPLSCASRNSTNDLADPHQQDHGIARLRGYHPRLARKAARRSPRPAAGR